MPRRLTPAVSLAPPKYQDANAWIRAKRELYPGLLQKDVARRIGCSGSHWRHIEAGHYELPFYLKTKYLDYLEELQRLHDDDARRQAALGRRAA